MDPTTVMQPDPVGKKLGPIWLTSGIGYGNAATSIYASFTTIGLLIYLGFVQPYLLTEVLNIPQSEQGSITGRLASLTEVVQIIAMSTIGAVSDQWGRRIIYVLGFVFLGIGYFLYPLADSVLQLTIFRLIFAVGAASIPTMLAAIVIDYSQPISRGKWFGVSNFCGALGILFVIVFMATGEENTPRGPKKLISCFLVDRDTPGFSIQSGYQCVSHRGYQNCILTFDDCRLSQHQLLGELHKGFDVANEWLYATRITVAAMCVGRARRTLDYALDWAAQREQFGQIIGKFQGVSFKLADMVTQLDAADWLTLSSALSRIHI